jgi:hypothetical protein
MAHLLHEGDRCFFYMIAMPSYEARTKINTSLIHNRKRKGNFDCKNNVNLFRANFYTIINDTLIVKMYKEHNRDLDKSKFYSMPVIWITKIQTLDDIFGKIFPVEISRIIDTYLL